MGTANLVLAIIGGICTVLSILFVILTYGKSRSKDAQDIQVRLAKIETDIAYIRANQDEDKDWKRSIERRITNLEKK